MGRNKNKYVKEKYNQPGFLYTKDSKSNVQSPLDEFMESNGYQKDVVYSENKDKRWTLKEELATKIPKCKDDKTVSVLYEMDSFKPSESTLFAISEKQTKGNRVNISSACNEALGKKSKKCQKCTKGDNNSSTTDETDAKSCSMIVFCKDIYSKKGIYCSCCRQEEVKQRIKFRNEKVKAFSECAYDPYYDEVEETIEDNNPSESQPSLRPMSIDIGAIFNEPNNNLRFKPRDPDNGFELINTKFSDDKDPSSDFEYVEDDDVKLD